MMPMADIFAPDINIAPARGIYPTANGGTSAGAAGAMTNSTNSVVSDASGSGGAVVTAGPALQVSGHSLFWWVGFLTLLMVMVWAARKAGGEDEFRNIRPTFYNFLAITLTAIVGIVGLKVIFSRWRIPGASDVIMAV